MAPRLELQALLLEICENVYFQPPPDLQMKYPCIVYNRDDEDTRYADDRPYKQVRKYRLTYIDRDPDTEAVLSRISLLPRCTYDRYYAADNLNHDVYTLFF